MLQPIAPEAGAAVRAMPLGAAERTPRTSTVVDGTPRRLDLVFAHYHAALKHTPRALRYLEWRGLTHPKLIDAFQLGFSDRSIGRLLPANETQEGDAMRGALQRLGVLKRNGHERFRGALVIPVLDTEGRVVDIYGRRISPGNRTGTPKHVTLFDPPRGVFNLPALAAHREVILCQSFIDALTLWGIGYPNVTATLEPRGLTEAHLEAFAACGTKRVIIAFNRGEAGDNAARLVAQALLVVGVECKRILMPGLSDVNAYARRYGGAALKALVEAAVPLSPCPPA